MDTNKLKELAELATPGPWVVDAQQSGAIFNIESESGDLCIAMSQENPASTRLEMNEQRRVNAEFIAAANPQAILALLDEIDRLKAEKDAFRSALKPFADYCTATDGKGIRLAIGGSCGGTEIDRTEWKAAQAALEGATK
ncbi:TPA: ead/Ea22-like family protein [Pseudomonas aeruginosa]|uniref:ead/Ea22-like family protein n=1 Tax=Pseudomonas aeruginosa TaxID=287 RepID=UPI00071B2510|nr:ead/Ea22-like family protein [Pseudomonas aeruginosa]HCC4913449.1 ead/Ea22-like family protein [Pseudomonas aeruginosa]